MFDHDAGRRGRDPSSPPPGGGALAGPADIWASIVKDFSNITRAVGLRRLRPGADDRPGAGRRQCDRGRRAGGGLPAEQRKKVIFIGVLAALVLRILFALVVTQLMQIIGLILVGGLLLLWVSWRMWRDLRQHGRKRGSDRKIFGDEHSGLKPAKSFAGAAWAVAIADVSMSLDNVLAVAGAAREHPGILIVGLVFAVALMGIAANIIARYIERYRWIAYIGLAGHRLCRGQDDLRRLGRSACRPRPAVRGMMASAGGDTIVALSSGRPPAAIAVVRTSGPAALAAAKRLPEICRRRAAAALRRLIDPATASLIDEALVLRFDAPNRDGRKYR